MACFAKAPLFYNSISILQAENIFENESIVNNLHDAIYYKISNIYLLRNL